MACIISSETCFNLAIAGARTRPITYLQRRSNDDVMDAQALHWMMEREETGNARGRGHLRLHPSFLQLLLSDGTLLHFQRVSPFRITLSLPTAPLSTLRSSFWPESVLEIYSTLVCFSLWLHLFKFAPWPLLGRYDAVCLNGVFIYLQCSSFPDGVSHAHCFALQPRSIEPSYHLLPNS